jgi:hypothetical protein
MKIKAKEKRKIAEICREIKEFCWAIPFTAEQCEYIKNSLLRAYLLGVIATLEEELNKKNKNEKTK